jgi:hypothetical protein
MNDLLTVNVVNVGGFAIPFDAVLSYEDGTTEKLHFSPSVWEKDQKITDLVIPIKKKVKSEIGWRNLSWIILRKITVKFKNESLQDMKAFVILKIGS